MDAVRDAWNRLVAALRRLVCRGAQSGPDRTG